MAPLDFRAAVRAVLFLIDVILAGFFLLTLFLADVVLAGFFLPAFFLVTNFLTGFFLLTFFLVTDFLASFFLPAFFLATFFLVAFFFVTFFRAAVFRAFDGAFFREDFFFATIRFSPSGYKSTARLYIWGGEFKGVKSNLW
jgi:hypothetical protein